jgi:hypothetical protein
MEISKPRTRALKRFAATPEDSRGPAGELHYWKHEDEKTLRRLDGAAVKADSGNPKRPWTATGPARNPRLIVAVLGKRSPRTWRTSSEAIQAVDAQVPVREEVKRLQHCARSVKRFIAIYLGTDLRTDERVNQSDFLPRSQWGVWP